MKSLGINHFAVLAALAMHALLLTVSAGPKPLPPERPQRISVRLLTAAETGEPAPVQSIPRPVNPRPVVEKEIQKQIMALPRPEVPSTPVLPKPTPSAEPEPVIVSEPVAASASAPEPMAVPTPTHTATAAPAPAIPASAPEPLQALPQPAVPSAPAARLAEYLNMVRAAVELNKDYPAFARQLGQQGTAMVQVQIDRKGRLLRAVILGSSGHSSLDKAALAAVRNAGRFRAPADFGLAEVTVDIPIAYKLI
jgi:protein TonB